MGKVEFARTAGMLWQACEQQWQLTDREINLFRGLNSLARANYDR
jgi:hypothetical protein